MSGLVARGNFTVGTTWKNGKATEVRLTSNKGKQAAVKITAGGAQNYEVKNGDTAVNAKVVTNADGASLLVFDTTAGTTYTIAKKASANVPVTGVTVTGANTATAGDTVTLTATVAPADATDKTVTWKSSDESVATVDKDGVVTAKKAGTVTITATAGGVSGTLHITVTAKPVETRPRHQRGGHVEAGTTVSVGKTLQATATVKPGNATNKKVTWKSSDESIATVDANGVITAKKAARSSSRPPRPTARTSPAASRSPSWMRPSRRRPQVRQGRLPAT